MARATHSPPRPAGRIVGEPGPERGESSFGDLAIHNPAAIALAAGAIGFLIGRLIGLRRTGRNSRATQPAFTGRPPADFPARISPGSMKRHGDKFANVLRTSGVDSENRAPTYPEG